MNNNKDCQGTETLNTEEKQYRKIPVRQIKMKHKKR
jgi:hypothetical protein